eukprot:snap_masked-scaffold_4-processed-gene-16.42-mRNA-1 protein AED:0.00 eAED:0.00 QI:0/-1/0/1/-1/1/1/0/335
MPSLTESVPEPVAPPKIISPAEHSSTNSDLDRQIAQLLRCEPLPEDEVQDLCNKVLELLIQNPNILQLRAPIVVCGDVHGQFYDVLELLKVGGNAPETNYLFLGDFVDRGFYSVETFQLLLALKVRYPDKIHLIRGNHECRQITQVYGFYDEVLRKYGSVNVWKNCTEVFDHLSLSAIISSSESSEKFFCVHGGLSPSIQNFEDILLLDRFQELPHDGPMCDLLWSDPEAVAEWGISPRGAGFLFGEKAVNEFCHTNDVAKIIRAHQLALAGYNELFNKKIVTVWSAPNYCYRRGNDASIMEIDENLSSEYKIFKAAPASVRGVPKKLPEPQYFL